LDIEKLIFVEDSYGVDFHRKLLERLKTLNLINVSSNPKIFRIPTTGCNQALVRKTKARIIGVSSWRMLFVIDSEGLSIEEASRRVLEHFEPVERVLIRVAVVKPMHEAWLCIGLGGDRSRCRDNPIYELSKLLNKPYDDKSLLAKYVERIDITKLLSEEDFNTYLDHLRWLLA